MITSLDLQYFKCFRKLRLPLAPLTLLSGTNAAGKSTALQALVLLHQTMLEHEWSIRLQLNGPELKLGTAGDVIDKVHGRFGFSIGIVDDSIEIEWDFSCNNDKQALSVAVTNIRSNGGTFKNLPKLRFLFPEEMSGREPLLERIRGLTYLTAERVGPRDMYPLLDPNTTQVVGPRGENAIGLLFQQREQAVLPKLALNTAPPTLIKQVEARMRSFFPGTILDLEKVTQINSVILGLRTSDDTDFHRPVNVGFGLTQVLPVIVAALAAKKDSILLIENPEVHLHPAGQALMGQFLAEVAAAGVQVLVESHSDHVLNGIRRAAKAKAIHCEQVALHFFTPREEGRAQVQSPILNPVGNIDHWPDGFFDQFDKDMNYFAGWGT